MTADDDRRDAIRDELARVEESAKFSAQTQLEQSKIWSRVNLWLGIAASALAAVAGALALADPMSQVVAGAMAIVAAVLGVILVSINAQSRTNAAAAAGNAYLAIQNEARQVRTVDLDYVPVDEARSQLSELTARRDEQNKTAEVASGWAYRRGRKNIRSGGQTYEVDKSDS